MNFQKISKEKLNQLILVGLFTILALGSLGYFLISPQYAELRGLANATADATKTLARMKDTIQRAEEIENRLAAASKTLATQEAEMGAGDLYSWGLDLFRRFRAAYKVEVATVAQPVVTECSLLPKFPYKQAAFTLSGSAYYHDLGRFIADFENQHPHMRIVNLGLDPASSLNVADNEKLEFKLDVVTLVRPNQN